MSCQVRFFKVKFVTHVTHDASLGAFIAIDSFFKCAFNKIINACISFNMLDCTCACTNLNSNPNPNLNDYSNPNLNPKNDFLCI